MERILRFSLFVPLALALFLSLVAQFLPFREEPPLIVGILITGYAAYRYARGRVLRLLSHLAEANQRQLGQLERERNQIRALLAALPDPVLNFNSEGELQYLNPAAQIALDLERQHVIGRRLARSWTSLLGPNVDLREIRLPTHKPGSNLLAQAEAMAERGGGTVRLGSERTYHVTVIPIDNGRVLVLRDQTDLRRLEEVRTLFLGSVSHELRTPLTIIKGFAVTLLDHPSLAEQTDMQKPLRRIDQEADRLTRLVNDLLDLTQMQTKRLTIEPTLTSPDEVVDETAGLLHPLAERQQVRLEAHLDGACQVQLDRDRIKQVLINLTDNAIKFTPPTGTVYLRTKVAAGSWMLSVTDTGPGVPEKDLPHLFEHFFRGRSTRKVSGTGLGLAIVKEIVNVHGGDISVSSPPGEGLTVTVRLPLLPPELQL